MSGQSVHQGLVIQHGANRYLVEGPGGPQDEWACSIAGRLRKGRRERVRPAVIGDRVEFRATGEDDREGVIEAVLPRRNKISRPAPSGGSRKRLEQVVIANLDRIWVMVALAEPPLSRRFLDRVLAASAHQGVDAGVILNKADLPEAIDPAPLIQLYESLGYPVRVCSAVSGLGVGELSEELTGTISAFVGPSGVGKSSLLQEIQPGLVIRVASVGEKSKQGRHTTTTSRLYRLDSGGYVADTPGMREFGMWGMTPLELRDAFVEFRELPTTCRFGDCLHRGEPACGVQAAVDAGTIAPERHASYLSLVDELRDEADGGRPPR